MVGIDIRQPLATAPGADSSPDSTADSRPRCCSIVYLRRQVRNDIRQTHTRMITIAVTGGMGAGKSETAKLLQQRGARVVHADQIAHRTYARGAPAFEAIVAAFGDGILTADGDIDRARLGDIVFASPQRRRQLEAIVWPAARTLITREIGDLRSRGCDVAALEAAVLYEAGWDDLADVVVTVEASEPTRLRRVRERTGMSDAAIRERFAAQLPSATRIRRADHCLTNDGTRADLADEVARIWNTIATDTTRGD